jgi:hypothetical protein
VCTLHINQYTVVEGTGERGSNGVIAIRGWADVSRGVVVGGCIDFVRCRTSHCGRLLSLPVPELNSIQNFKRFSTKKI